MTWRKKLEKLRDEKNLSQGEVARAIGLQPSRISRWESGEGDLSMVQALNLSRLLGVTLDYFADDTQDDPPPPACTEQERVVLDFMRDLKLNQREALRRLAVGGPADGAEAGAEDRPRGNRVNEGVTTFDVYEDAVDRRKGR